MKIKKVERVNGVPWLQEAVYRVEVEYSFLFFRWIEAYYAGKEEPVGLWEWYSVDSHCYITNDSTMCDLDEAVLEFLENEK